MPPPSPPRPTAPPPARSSPLRLHRRALSQLQGEEVAKSDRPELASAKIIISGGRALGSAEAFAKVIEPAADRLGAAMGALRAVVDAGYAPNDWTNAHSRLAGSSTRWESVHRPLALPRKQLDLRRVHTIFRRLCNLHSPFTQQLPRDSKKSL